MDAMMQTMATGTPTISRYLRSDDGTPGLDSRESLASTPAHMAAISKIPMATRVYARDAASRFLRTSRGGMGGIAGSIFGRSTANALRTPITKETGAQNAAAFL